MTDKTPAKKVAKKPATLENRKAAETEAADNPKTNEPEPADPHVPNAEVAAELDHIDAGLVAWARAQANIDKLRDDLERDDLQPRTRDEVLARIEGHEREQAEARAQILGK